MNRFTVYILLGVILLAVACSNLPSSNTNASPDTKEATSSSQHMISMTKTPITIDGRADEAAWKQVSWKNIDQTWIGADPSPEDFKGRYKLLWDADRMYVLAEIQDDTLIDIHANGLDRYWDDDCLEIFIDENQSRDIHQYNHSAFAYHIALDGKVADIGLDSLPRYYDHLISSRITSGNLSTWEVAMQLYPDSYKDGSTMSPLQLSSGKKIGFAIAYCDNDYSAERENFIGSSVVEGDDKNRGWIDAGIFEKMILK